MQKVGSPIKAKLEREKLKKQEIGERARTADRGKCV